MERIRLLSICLLILALVSIAQAQEKEGAEKLKEEPKKAEGAAPDAPVEVKEAAPVKKRIRSGSYLVGNRGITPPSDLRGDFERRRDMEIIKHYTRRAQLDVIARRAKQVGRSDLLERLDRIRRVEDERHRLWMQELAQGAVFSEMRGLP